MQIETYYWPTEYHVEVLVYHLLVGHIGCSIAYCRNGQRADVTKKLVKRNRCFSSFLTKKDPHSMLKVNI